MNHAGSSRLRWCQYITVLVATVLKCIKWSQVSIDRFSWIRTAAGRNRSCSPLNCLQTEVAVVKQVWSSMLVGPHGRTRQDTARHGRTQQDTAGHSRKHGAGGLGHGFMWIVGSELPQWRSCTPKKSNWAACATTYIIVPSHATDLNYFKKCLKPMNGCPDAPPILFKGFQHDFHILL